MEFDINRVYTSVNADELKVGSKVIVADSLAWLRRYVEEDMPSETLKRVENDETQYRFIMTDESEYALAYLIEPSEEKKLKWTELKIGDVIRNKKSGLEFMVVGMCKEEDKISHILIESCWIDDESLATYWEKVE